MKTINRDVREIIPNIAEADYENSLFIVELWTDNNYNSDDPNSNYFGLIERKEHISPYDPYKYNYGIKDIRPCAYSIETHWAPYGHNLLEVIARVWSNYSRHYTIRIVILEDLLDISHWVNERIAQLNINEDSHKFNVWNFLNNQYANLPSHRQSE